MRLRSAGIDWVSFDTAFSAYQRHQNCHLCSGSRKQPRETFTTSKEIGSKIIILQGDDCHTVCIYTSMCFLLFLSSYIDCALWCGLRFPLNHCLRSGLSNMWPVDQNLPTKETNLVNCKYTLDGSPVHRGENTVRQKKNHCSEANLKLQMNLACMSLQKNKTKHAGTRRIWAYRKAPAGQ